MDSPLPFVVEKWAGNAWTLVRAYGSHHAASGNARLASQDGSMVRVKSTTTGLVSVTYRDGLAI